MNINLENSGLLPDGTKIKVFVGNKYSDGDMVNVYYYDKENNKLELIENKYSVKDGYVIFDVNKGNDYLVTMSTILDSNEEVVTQSKSTSILIPIIIILSLIVVTSFVFIIMKKRKDNQYVNKTENAETLDTYSFEEKQSNNIQFTNFNSSLNNNSNNNVSNNSSNSSGINNNVYNNTNNSSGINNTSNINGTSSSNNSNNGNNYPFN